MYGDRARAAQSERQSFEYFARQADLSRDSTGNYINQFVAFAWAAWQQRADYPPRQGNALWVAVSERLPPPYWPVLLYDWQREAVETGFWRNDRNDWEYVLTGGKTAAANISYWQPLPTAPQGPSENQR